MNTAELMLLRRLEDEQVGLFRSFMAMPEERQAIIERLVAIKGAIDGITLPTTVRVAPPEPKKHKVRRISSEARLRYFQPGRG